MATKKKDSSGGGSSNGSGGTGGAGGKSQTDDQNDDDQEDIGDDDDGDDEEPKGKRVSRDAYERVLTQAKTRAKKLKDAETELADLRSKLSDGTKKKLEEDGEFKKLLDTERAERKKDLERITELENSVKGFKQKDDDRRRFAALSKAIGGALDPKFHRLVDWDEIAIDPETDEIDDTSLTRYARKFKEEYGTLIVGGKGTTGMPSKNPGGSGGKGSGKITQSEFNKLSTAEMRKYKPEDIIGE